MSWRGRGGANAVLGCLVVACLSPIMVLIAALLTRTGVVSPDLGYDLLARRVAFGLAFVGLIAAALAIWFALTTRGGRLLAAVTTLVAVGVIGGFAWQLPSRGSTHPEDVSTDPFELPGFGILAAERLGRGPDRVVSAEECPGAVPVMTQSLPESVVYELQHLGFGVRRAGVTGVYGTRRTFWFGFTEDVAVRIRPGRTDIRVAARDGRSHDGRACRVVTQISQALSVGEARSTSIRR